MRYIILAMLLAVFSTPVVAEEIKTKDQLRAYLKDQLRAYLKEKLPDGQMITSNWATGQKMDGQCLPPFRLPLIAELMLQDNLMQIGLSARHNRYQCTFVITGFDTGRLREFDVKIDSSHDGNDVSIKIPLARQDFLGIQGVDLKGGTFLGDTQCNLYFTPFFRNYDQSAFVMRFKDEFLEHYRYKNIFEEEAKTSDWCLEEKYDGTYNWYDWERY